MPIDTSWCPEIANETDLFIPDAIFQTNIMTENHNFDTDFIFDTLRGLAALHKSELIGNLAQTVTRFPRQDLSVAFNHKQIASKLWLRDHLFETLGGEHACIWVLGGWYGVLPAILFEDPRFNARNILNIDIDPACSAVATSLNAQKAVSGNFTSVTAAMEALDYGGINKPSLVINTSCEHILDLKRALEPIPVGTALVLQSNNYHREPDHVSCVDDLDAFEFQAGLAKTLFRGELETRNYTRFMLIGYR